MLSRARQFEQVATHDEWVKKRLRVHVQIMQRGSPMGGRVGLCSEADSPTERDRSGDAEHAFHSGGRVPGTVQRYG